MLALRPQPTRAPTTVPPSRASASATLATSSPTGARCLSPRFVARSLRRATESNDAGTASSPRRRCSTRVLVSRVSRTPPSPPRTSPSPSPSRRRPRPVYPDDTSAPLFDSRAPPPRRTPLSPARRDPTRGDPSLERRRRRFASPLPPRAFAAPPPPLPRVVSPPPRAPPSPLAMWDTCRARTTRTRTSNSGASPPGRVSPSSTSAERGPRGAAIAARARTARSPRRRSSRGG